MNTTVLFVENIIIGFQGALWIVLFIAPFVELGNIITWMCKLQDWSMLITIIAVAFIYSLGIILGRVFNIVAGVIRFKLKKLITFRRLLRIKWVKEFYRTAHDKKLVEVGHQVGILKSYYLYISSRTRIAEATMFNLPLIAAGSYLNLCLKRQFVWAFLAWCFGVLTLLCIVVYVTFLVTLKARKEQVLKNKNIKPCC